MDQTKRAALIALLASQAEPRLLPIAQFFDGNDDLGSIGCNLGAHPGIAVFRDVFASLARRPDVDAIYARIAELDAGDDSWPFADTVFVVGAISQDALASALARLEPDSIGPAGDFGVPEPIVRRHAAPVLAAWWD